MTVHEPDQTRQEPAPDFGSMLLRVAWLAILLGLGMEVLLLVLGGAVGDVLGVGPIVADFVRNITWSVFVCVGLAVGTAVAKARVPIMGALGLFSAPLAFEASRVFHKGTLEALAVSVPGGEELSPVLIAVVKGIEYGCLGLGVGWVSQRPWGGAAAHVAVGLLVGLVFGAVRIALTSTVTPPPPATDLFVEGINEVLFPVGCALVLFSANVLGKRVANRA
ncbi:MAG TPA: hypothetical protein VHH10_03415 [Rubrobacteraceae bacterium]|nr:hypothetical protein [Rubrobacteraceae bacterium]